MKKRKRIEENNNNKEKRLTKERCKNEEEQKNSGMKGKGSIDISCRYLFGNLQDDSFSSVL